MKGSLNRIRYICITKTRRLLRYNCLKTKKPMRYLITIYHIYVACSRDRNHKCMRRLYGYVAIKPPSFSFPLNSQNVLLHLSLLLSRFFTWVLIYKIMLRLYRKHLIHLFLKEIFHSCERDLETIVWLPSFWFCHNFPRPLCICTNYLIKKDS